MRRAAKIDANQPHIIAALRKIGAQVVPLHMVGSGVPDLLVNFRRTFLMEVKDGSKPPSARALTSDQQEFHSWWTGEVHVVESVDDAIRVTLREK